MGEALAAIETLRVGDRQGVVADVLNLIDDRRTLREELWSRIEELEAGDWVEVLPADLDQVFS